MDVAVLGSLNVDVVFRCATFPRPGETILCDAVETGPGGKGLNQAVASARSGAQTSLIGAVGADAHAALLLDFLSEEGVDVARIERLTACATGLAHILVDRYGENAIVVASGANYAVAPVLPSPARVLLAQLEVPPNIVETFLRQFSSPGAVKILNAAPATGAATGLIPYCDILVVNEHELGQLSGVSVAADDEAAVAAAASSLLARSDQTVVVTLGARGTQMVNSLESRRIPTRPAAASDTTGAGDCFCGVLAASLATSCSLSEAIERANRAASIAVTRAGAAVAMPYADEIDAGHV